jgi:hypothetical protein
MNENYKTVKAFSNLAKWSTCAFHEKSEEILTSINFKWSTRSILSPLIMTFDTLLASL